jgi:3-methylfumaryl-CoA hydratase
MSDYEKWIGKEQTHHDGLTEIAARQFAATLGELAHLPEGQAPLGIHWCLGSPTDPRADLDVDGHPKRGGCIPPIPLPRRMWASSALEFFTPICVGDDIERVSRITEVSQKTGNAGPLVFLTIEHETYANQSLCVHERQSIVYLNPSNGQLALPKSRTDLKNIDGWQMLETITPTPALLFRYSALTFNSHRIHYDADYARDVEAYPACVVHGPFMASYLLKLIQSHYAAHVVRKFQFRGKSPAYVDQALHFMVQQDDKILSLQVMNNDRDIIMQATAELG